MQDKQMSICKYDGCFALTRSEYCDKHRLPSCSSYKGNFSKDTYKTDYQRRRALYGTKRWKEMRAIHLLIEPFCRECMKEDGDEVRAIDVDHIIPHRGDRKLFYDSTNIQSLCKYHHRKKTAGESLELKT